MRNSTRSSGVTVIGLLGIAFIVLKLIDKIDWPWLWVLAPFWGPLVLWLTILGIGLLVVAIRDARRHRRPRQRR